MTIDNVRARLDETFAPDMSVKFDDRFKCWIFKPITDLGMAWNKRYKGVVTKQGFLVANSNFEDCYNSMLKCGLTVETIE